MSVELPLTSDEKLKHRKYLIDYFCRENNLSVQDDAIIIPMEDGGMGGFKIKRRPGIGDVEKEVAQYVYRDIDGVVVSIAVMSDKNHQISSVDFWKVNFSPVLSCPEIRDLEKTSPSEELW